MNSKKVIPIAALLTVLIIAALGTVDRWMTQREEPTALQSKEAVATQEDNIALALASEPETEARILEPTAVSMDSTDQDEKTINIPGTGIPIWPKP